jgi:hypothetical protein
MALCTEPHCIRPATLSGRCVLHNLPRRRAIRIKNTVRRVLGVIAEVCDTCSFSLDSDQHVNHCRG